MSAPTSNLPPFLGLVPSYFVRLCFRVLGPVCPSCIYLFTQSQESLWLEDYKGMLFSRDQIARRT